jgi:hypothetical protein
MNFNLVSKNNIGIVGTLVLAIFLSQNRTMDFMFRTSLGRMFLIILILAMSYTNKILGVVGVLFIVIIFSSSNMNFMEGLENAVPSTSTVPSTADPSAITNAIPSLINGITSGDATDIPSLSSLTSGITETTTTTETSTAVKPKQKAAVGTPLDEAQTGVTETTDVTTEDTSDSINTTENAGVESFDIIGLERNIQKGKNSNSIPINNNNNNDNILPTDFFNKLGFSIF